MKKKKTNDKWQMTNDKLEMTNGKWEMANYNLKRTLGEIEYLHLQYSSIICHWNF